MKYFQQLKTELVLTEKIKYFWRKRDEWMTALLLSSLNLNYIVTSWFMKIYWSTNNISYEEGKIWRKWRKQILSFVSSDYENKPGVDRVLVILISVSDYWHRCIVWPQEKSIFTNCNKNLTVSGLNLFELFLRLGFRIFRELFDPIKMLYGKNYFCVSEYPPVTSGEVLLLFT